MELRPYQRAAVEAVYRYLREHDDNPCVVIPTAGGKTPILATICKDAVGRWQGRVLILAHVKELLQQAADKLNAICPDLPFGVYSAGLGMRDTQEPVIIAGIQSVFRLAKKLGHFDLVIVDECFVPGTRVLTPSGDTPIEQIQPGMFVRNATGIGKVEAVAARSARNLVTLEYDDGTTIKCTANHPIFTDSGWKAAGSLEIGSLAFGIKGVRMLRQGISTPDQEAGGRQPEGPERAAVDEAAILLHLLRKDPQQLHDLARSPHPIEQVHESQRPFASHPRRQRSAHEAAAGTAHCSGSQMDRRTQCAGARLQARAITEASENRPCPSWSTGRIGAGRSQPSVATAQAPGLAQDAFSGAKRLVRLTHHESASGSVVFNLQVSGHPSYFANGLLVHNCHMIPADGEGMYRTLLAELKAINPILRIIGLTATPYRLSSGSICEPANVLNAVCYEVGVRELIDQGYLCPLRSKAGKQKVDTSSLHVRGGEYIASEVEALMDDEAIVDAACREIVELARERKSCLVFTSGVQHGKHVAKKLKERGQHVETVFGDTLDFIRDQALADFRAGHIKYLVNVNVLTTGFDAPNIDCVVLLRPTLSPGLYYQMVGRGFRLHPDKENCLILDFGGNVLRHGPVDAIRIRRNGKEVPASPKECPSCQEIVPSNCKVCPECGYEWETEECAGAKHDTTAGDTDILSGGVTFSTYPVEEVLYSVHHKRGAGPDAPRTMRVQYRVGWHTFVSEWICVEHGGYAREKAERWWNRRSHLPTPENADEAVRLAEAGALCEPTSITVRSDPDSKYDRITGYELGDKPNYREPGWEPEDEDPIEVVPGIDDDDIPF